MSARSAAVVLGLVLMAGCPRKHAPTVSTTSETIVEWQHSEKRTTPAEHLTTMAVQGVAVTPNPLRRSAPATVRFDTSTGFAGAKLKLSWFGPDGWLVFDQAGGIAGTAATFTIPSGTFPSAGRYHYQLDSGNVEVTNGVIEVAD